MSLNSVAIIIYVVWNIIVFAIYGIDKRKAQHEKRRISEKVLIASAFCMGGFGAMLGMTKFHHKTSKMKFMIGIPFALVLNIAVIALWAYFFWK